MTNKITIDPLEQRVEFQLIKLHFFTETVLFKAPLDIGHVLARNSALGIDAKKKVLISCSQCYTLIATLGNHCCLKTLLYKGTSTLSCKRLLEVC